MTQNPEHDDKDWTWVLGQPCPDCGFAAEQFDVSTTGDAIRSNCVSWEQILLGDATQLRQRRRTDRWSDLEYAAHVRDVYRIFFERLHLMLDGDDPLFANWDQNETATADAYNEQVPSLVSAELIAAGHALAEAFDGLEPTQLNRTGRRSDGASFTVDSFARYLVHDPVHHLWDVRGA